MSILQTSTPTPERFLTQIWPRQPNPMTLGYPKLQNLIRLLEKKLFLGSARSLLANIYIRLHVCNHRCTPFNHMWTAKPISAKFWKGLPTNSGKILSTSMTPPILPPAPNVSHTPKSKQINMQKKQCATKIPIWVLYFLVLIMLKFQFWAFEKREQK